MIGSNGLSLRQVEALKATRDLAQSLGIDATGGRVVREASAVLVELPEANVYARLESRGQEDNARKQVHIARFWAVRGAPTLRLAPYDGQPFLTDVGAITLWERLIPVDAVPLESHKIGALIRSVHLNSKGPWPDVLPTLKFLSQALSWLQTPSKVVDDDMRAELYAKGVALRMKVQQIMGEDPLGQRVLHGDVHVDNIIVTKDGPVLLDLEGAGIGPASWDLTAPAVGVRHYGHSQTAFEDLIQGYGEDPRTWEGFELLCDVYELEVCAWAIHNGESSELIAEEGRKRALTVLGIEDHRWTLL